MSHAGYIHLCIIPVSKPTFAFSSNALGRRFLCYSCTWIHFVVLAGHPGTICRTIPATINGWSSFSRHFFLFSTTRMGKHVENRYFQTRYFLRLLPSNLSPELGYNLENETRYSIYIQYLYTVSRYCIYIQYLDTVLCPTLVTTVFRNPPPSSSPSSIECQLSQGQSSGAEDTCRYAKLLRAPHLATDGANPAAGEQCTSVWRKVHKKMGYKNYSVKLGKWAPSLSPYMLCSSYMVQCALAV